MPRSQDPEAYPEFFAKLLKALTGAHTSTFRFAQPTGRNAVDLKNQWYAFRRALLHKSEALRKAGDLDGASSYQTHYRATLQWAALLRPKPPSYKDAQAYRSFLESPSGVTFINISEQPEFLDLENQLAAQLKQNYETPTTTIHHVEPEHPSPLESLIKDKFMPQDPE